MRCLPRTISTASPSSDNTALAASFGSRQRLGKESERDVSDPFGGLTVEHAGRDVARRLASARNDSTELDARLLVGHVLGLDLTGMISAAARALTPDQSRALEILVGRRLAGEP